MMNFEFNTTRSVSVDRGGLVRLPQRLTEMGVTSVLVVTDPGVRAAGLLDRLIAGLQASKIRARVFDAITPDPSEEVILAAAKAAAAVDCVVGLGGGSSMDAAKLAALLAASQQPLSEVYGVGLAHGPRLPLVLVPTTAGTGSEVTPISIVTRGTDQKAGVVSSLLLPDLALLDAELTTGLPRHVTAATGIDAMVHAIEAYTSKRLKNPVSDCLAREALRLLSSSIGVACEDGGNVEAREQMLLGACLAGMAFANAPVAAVHALAYPIGARFHVPHGLSNSLVLGPVINFNREAAAEPYAELAAIVDPRASGSPEARAAALVTYLQQLPLQFGLPTKLREVGIAREDLPALAADAMKQTRLLINNPRELRQEDALALYTEAF